MSGTNCDAISVAGPSITDLEIGYVTDAVKNCWYGEANKYHSLFQKAFAQYIGVKHAIALPSCTSGLHLALAALRVGPGDEVIVPEITWIATSAPVSYVGATPVFCDVDPDTWCVDVASAEACITSNTKAIIAVDIYGGVPDWQMLREMAERHGLPVIEDAAEAIGTEYRGKKAGALGDIGVFSFHGSKTLTTGEGGMLVTDDSEVAARVEFLRDHGRTPGDVTFKNEEVAFKYKMSAMQAALGLAQLERVDELVNKKREIFSNYRKYLGGIEEIVMNREPEGVKNSYWMSSIIVAEQIVFPKLELMEILKKNFGIDTRPFFSPLSSIPAYSDGSIGERVENPVAYSVSRQGLNLPSALSLREEDIRRVSDAVAATIRGRGQN